ncbi:hypothetical protein [Tardiphaga sp.]|jgi:hypothetical protein|uniref:hypothetical protein n=1 Tax=Tardiphaga sp. TaxID=1926292 RepID=UPI0037DA24A1
MNFLRRILHRPAPPSDVDLLCQQNIKATLEFAPANARESAEMIMGRPLTDREWANHSAIWIRNWEALGL